LMATEWMQRKMDAYETASCYDRVVGHEESSSAAGAWLLLAGRQPAGMRIMGLPAAFGGQHQQCGSRAKVSCFLACASHGLRLLCPLGRHALSDA